MRFNQGIEKQTRLWFLFVSMVPLFIVGILGLYHMRHLLWDGMQGEIARSISERENSLKRLVSDYKSRLDFFAANHLTQNLLAEFIALKSEERAQFLQKDRHTLQIEIKEFLDISGFISIRLSGKEGTTVLSHQTHQLEDLFSRERHFNPKEKETRVNFVRSRDGQSYVKVEGPVFLHSPHHDDPIGHVTLIADIDEIENLLSTSPWPIFLLNHKRELIARLPETIDTGIIPEALIKKAVQGNTGITELEEHLIAYRYFSETGGALLVLFEKDELFVGITQMNKTFIAGCFMTIFIVLLLSSKASRNIVKPINHLLKGVKSVTAGNLDSQVAVKDKGEIGLLAGHFNEMIQHIKERNKDLTDFKYALDQAAIVAVTDEQGIIQYANDAFCDISKYSREELIGRDHSTISSGSHSKGFIRNMWETIGRGEVWRGHFKNKSKDGTLYWVDTTIVPFLNAEGTPYQYLSIRTDITKRKQAEDKIRFLAQYDELTKLPNRSLFNERLNQVIKQRSWGKHPFAVMFLDLDRFKLINDTLGHTVGDQLLQEIAKRLTHCLREGDTVARMGGDEFTILLPAIAKGEDVVIVAQKIVDALKKPVSLGRQELLVSSSIGISLYPNDGEDPETLLKHADAAMYRAKENRRGRFNFFAPVINADGNSKIDMAAALSHAIERDELRLLYQPLVDLKHGTITGVEALIRWERGGKNGEKSLMVSPAAFIPLAEETSLILPIGDWVLRKATFQLKDWQNAGFSGLCMSVNVAASQFQEANFVTDLKEIIEKTGLPRNTLKLELTETLLMKNQDMVTRRLAAIKDLGVRLAIDDFGTGYSSLSYLKRFPVDTLKIDQSFVRNIPDDADDAAIAEMVLALANQLKMEVVAEGIETKAQLAFLQMRGCQTGQGYLFSKPVSAEAMTKLLSKTFELDHMNARSPDVVVMPPDLSATLKSPQSSL